VYGYDGQESVSLIGTPKIKLQMIFSFKVEEFLFTHFDGVAAFPNQCKQGSFVDALASSSLSEV